MDDGEEEIRPWISAETIALGCMFWVILLAATFAVWILYH